MCGTSKNSNRQEDLPAAEALIRAVEEHAHFNSLRYARGEIPPLSERALRNTVKTQDGATFEEPLTVFHSSTIPTVSLEAFCKSLLATPSMPCDSITSTIAVVLMMRYEERSEIPVTRLMIHRLLIAAAQVAAKAHQDFIPTSGFVARATGLQTREVNRLELALLDAVDWQVNVARDDVVAFAVRSGLMKPPQRQQQCQRITRVDEVDEPDENAFDVAAMSDVDIDDVENRQPSLAVTETAVASDDDFDDAEEGEGRRRSNSSSAATSRQTSYAPTSRPSS